ncbi:XdhC family protein [Haloarcula sp. S1CR25-12]|uniref:XdhC family protein n=1 Tax=Haloarcula saliterrae TaxID=2950534 RepID=A0ABU2FFT2_9EURY|nr:XdhC family protein [Haloarcula sp. S1CR25-12]MDS0261117.1 XdhC family protein [Haloarcula sp. S1CR25-12]
MQRTNWSAPEPVFRRRLRDRFGTDDAAAVATVVDVRGSAYRRPGAKMLFEGTAATGSITAGCLETDLADASRRVRESGEPELRSYDLTSDESETWGLGVGCEGVVTVLLEPLSERYRPVVEAFGDRRHLGVLTVLADETGPLEPGSRAYYRPETGTLEPRDGSTRDAWGGQTLLERADELVARGRPAVTTQTSDGRSLRVFVDVVEPVPELVVFGSGHDVGPVVHAGTDAGFRVTVVGFRGGVDMAARFVDADRTLTTAPARIDERLDLTERTYAVVMTHNFVDDCLTVERLLASPAPYIGLLGPTDRYEKLVAELDPSPGTDLERVYAPVGLDLGGGSPHQIAQSIAAELLAVRNGKTPTHLRTADGPIHERPDP